MISSAKIHFIVACAVFVVLLSAYGWWYAVLSSRSAESAQLAGEIQSKGQDAERLKAAETALASISEDEATVASYFVSTADVVPFLESLQKVGTRLGTQVTIASVAASTDGGRQALELQLQLNGSFDAVLRTLGSIEYGPQYIRVTDLSLSTVPATAATDNAPARAAGWSATVSLIVGAEGAASSTQATPSVDTSSSDSTP